MEKIKFRSYIAVSKDSLQGKTLSEYLQTVRNQLSEAVANTVFSQEQDLVINGRTAHLMVADLSQQGVNYKVLMEVIRGQGESVWVVSFNTVRSSWDAYQEAFLSAAKSFSLKTRE